MRHTSQVPDMVLTNGKFYTQDLGTPTAEAIAIAGNRIMAMGSNKSINASAGPQTKQIDLEGRTGLPGMMDSHFHFHEWAFMRNQVDLAPVSTFGECMSHLKAVAYNKKPGEWILGNGFNESEWPENRKPLRSDLDLVSRDHPILVWRCDLHLAVANSNALAIAGIDATTPDPPEGKIEKDKHGEPTGILRELAINLAKIPILALMDKSIVQAMREAMSGLNALGLTGIHDIRLMGGLEGASALKAWQRLDSNGDMTLRSWVTVPGESIDEAITLGLTSGFGNDRLRLGHIKFFADGGMGARTAYLLEPYLDAEYGMPLTPMVELEAAIKKADENNLAVMIHGIGDRTNRELVNLLEKTGTESPQTDQTLGFGRSIPHRIEHLQMVRPEEIRRLAKMQRIVACVQPHNAVLDINMIDQCVGERGRYTYPFRDLLDAGVPLIFSSDCPVCDPSPLVGIHAAVTRQRADGTPENGWYPKQKVTVEEAVYAYTQAPATAAGMGDHLGSITPGKFADIVVLDRDIFAIPPQDILETGVYMTLFDGQIVYQC
ncbi:MAG: amidohydrolase [bacterium]